jgi:hypothetical protein
VPATAETCGRNVQAAGGLTVSSYRFAEDCVLRQQQRTDQPPGDVSFRALSGVVRGERPRCSPLRPVDGKAAAQLLHRPLLPAAGPCGCLCPSCPGAPGPAPPSNRGMTPLGLARARPPLGHGPGSWMVPSGALGAAAQADAQPSASASPKNIPVKHPSNGEEATRQNRKFSSYFAFQNQLPATPCNSLEIAVRSL